MAILKPFKGIRPIKEKASAIASRPYDVLDTEEARVIAKENPLSFLRVIKPELEFPEVSDHYAPEVYAKGLENFNQFVSDGLFKQDEQEVLYVYAQIMNGRTQYGLVGCAGVEDYMNNIIRKHELTRPDKEEDRMKHIRYSNLNYEPVFFSYRANANIDAIVAEVVEAEPEYYFTTDDGISHIFWVINNQKTVKQLVDLFAKVDYVYVADGHHRTAAAALVGNEKKKNNPNHTGKEEYNFFLAVHFPDNQLRIIDYNRVCEDLNGLSETEFLAKLNKSFTVTLKGKEIYKPAKLHEFSMYLNGKWYALVANSTTYNDNDPIGVLDVTILSNEILAPILDIVDLRKSKKIDFVGGIRGLGELVRRVDSGKMQVAFALYPVSMEQLINISDSGNIMPPKTTWFEPKLRSGLVLHDLK